MSIGKIAGVVISVATIMTGVMVFSERVPEGKVGVVYSPAGGVKDVLSPGWKPVGLFDKVTQYPVRLQTVKDKVTVSTIDGKKITLAVSYNMKVDSSKEKVIKIFKELGSQDIEQIQEGHLYSQLYKASREVVSKYSLLDIYGEKTTEASNEVTERFAELVAPLGFEISNVTLGAPDPDPKTQEAIDARIAASQETEKLKIQAENEKLKAENKKIEAEGNAEKARIEAQGQADANHKVQQSLTPEVLEKMEKEARIKHGWVEVNGGSVITQK
ncbi:prohibitin family protein [Bacillus wiedmannii]|uniref:prohibitin family protein n=1 Tax=Bacillus wiedmannii TaxID=1890302 RepID=UPI000BFBB6CD|nr:prohibitin family protein [Bacillus wiedmannii]PHE70581.1 hypothetical protein COF77_25550 [Bacillus wiedmannii]